MADANSQEIADRLNRGEDQDSMEAIAQAYSVPIDDGYGSVIECLVLTNGDRLARSVYRKDWGVQGNHQELTEQEAIADEMAQELIEQEKTEA